MISQLGAQPERNLSNVGVRNSGGADSVPQTPAKPSSVKSDAATKTAPQDSVELSTEARQLSQTQRDQNPVTTAQDMEPQKVEDTKRAKTSYFEVVKYFPPYLGDTKRLELLENYPQLLKEIKKMMVPPPLDMILSATNESGTTAKDTVKANK